MRVCEVIRGLILEQQRLRLLNIKQDEEAPLPHIAGRLATQLNLTYNNVPRHISAGWSRGATALYVYDGNESSYTAVTGKPIEESLLPDYWVALAMWAPPFMLESTQFKFVPTLMGLRAGKQNLYLYPFSDGPMRVFGPPDSSSEVAARSIRRTAFTHRTAVRLSHWFNTAYWYGDIRLIKELGGSDETTQKAG